MSEKIKSKVKKSVNKSENTNSNVEVENVKKENAGRKKTECPISREDFAENAKSIKVVIDGNSFDVDTKEFSTGSLGWFLNGKTKVDVGGVKVACQIGLNLTIIGSKELPE